MRLTQIHLRDFRAFPGEFELRLPGGCSLLIHGENGSGKSSLAGALRDFIALDRPLPRPIAPHAHAFTDPAHCQPRIQLVFEDGRNTDTIAWETSRLHPLEPDDGRTPASTTPAQRQALVDVARQSGFYDYRVLLRTSFRSGDGDLGEQLFLLFVENLLSGFPLVRGGAELVRDRWDVLRKTFPASRHDKRMREANRVAAPLNSALPGFLDHTRVEANRLLAAYFPNQRLVIRALTTPGCSFAKATKKLTGQRILPEIEYNGCLVDGHEEFLNEARLTALGLCMFLAALKLADFNPAASDPLRLLVLDDVLIGLDLSNRLPLLECLRVEFPHHQTILLTYDELWFNIAREHTAHWGTWRSAQMFAEVTGPVAPPIPRLKDTTDDLTVAKRYLNANDLRSAAVYIRAAFENRLRTICEDKHVKLDFKQDPKKVSADALWTAILSRQREMVAQGNTFVDPNLVPRIEAIRSQVLNRLAHDGGIGLTTPDVQAAITTMQAFRASRIPFSP
ncbi:MAG TPA: ATP-binding protein [Candidatus Paceibacterota bacterium]|nr:ATP-binding protein [Verrucomicrobiota bacterium]HRY49122.1 ATP-binding protein [Candidatus Paceibacterota bacterium]